MYRDDDAARAERAHVLIEEIARLERAKVAQAVAEDRLAAARAELRTLQPARRERAPGLGTHLLVFAGAAGAAFLAYTVLLAG